MTAIGLSAMWSLIKVEHKPEYTEDNLYWCGSDIIAQRTLFGQ